MARGRMINATIAADLKLNELSLEAHLAYLMAIPHLDRDGCMAGHPRIVAGRICPLRPEIGANMPAIMQEWTMAQLVICYESSNGPVLFFTGFQKNQNLGTALYAREPKSIYPPPPGYIRTEGGLSQESNEPSGPLHEDYMQSTCNPHVEVKRSKEEDQVEEKEAAAADPDIAKVWIAYEANMPGTRTPVIVDSVNELLSKYSAAEIVEAIGIAVKRSNRSLSYIEGILKKGVFSQTPSGNKDKINEAAEASRRTLIANGKEHLL